MQSKNLGLTPVLLALLLQGCLRAPSLDPLRHDIESQMRGSRFDKELKLTLGPVSLLLARTLSRLVPGQEMAQARKMLAQVRRIEVAVYDIEASEGLSSRALPRRLRSMLQTGGWQMAVRTQNRDERVWILYREKHGRIRDFYVATLGRDELVLVRVAGNMERLVAWAVSDHGGGIFGHGKRREEPQAPLAETARAATR